MKFCHVSDLKTLLAALVYHFAGAVSLPSAHKNYKYPIMKKLMTSPSASLSPFPKLGHCGYLARLPDTEYKGEI